MTENKSKRINATVHIVSSPGEAPVGMLTRCLFGTSLQDLAAEIGSNKDGKWEDVYADV